MLAPHRGIIDSDTWLACRRKCLEHRRAGPKGTEKSSWLVGKVVCGICGSSLAVRKKGREEPGILFAAAESGITDARD